jgi:hypothetical protein
MIDRVKEEGSGGLLSSAPFLDATAALPDRPTSLTFFSLPRFMALIRDVVRQMDPDEALPPWPVGAAESSGIGIAYSSSGSALKVDTHVPRAEAQNIRAVFEYFKALEKTEEGGGESQPL